MTEPQIPEPRSWLCRHGIHAWRLTADGLSEVCKRCGKPGREIEDFWI